MYRDTLFSYIYLKNKISFMFDIIYDKNFAYLLGYLWADGYIERNRVILEILEEDALTIIDDINKISFLKIVTYKRHRKNRKPQMAIYFCNSKFYDDFLSKFFIEKNKSAPTELLKELPKNLHRYFYLGLIDGDGCFYLNIKNKIRQFIITSCYDQNWDHIKDLFRELNIEIFNENKIINKHKNKSSIIRLNKYDEILKIYKYLYPNGYEIGLLRKFDKCQSIIDFKPIHNSNQSKIDIIILKDKINDGLNIKELSVFYSCNWKKIYNLCKKNDISYPKNFFKNFLKKD